MLFANAEARPYSASNQVLRSMGSIVFPMGETLSRPTGEFYFSPSGFPIGTMVTVEETRRNRLRMLVEQHGSMANLCQALGYARNETATLTRIVNGNLRHDRDGKPYNMGGPMARQIEETLKLPAGWMDTPPGNEYTTNDERIQRVIRVMEAMPDWQVDQALKIIDTITEPTSKGNGTEG
jgi:hypothetical protein